MVRVPSGEAAPILGDYEPHPTGELVNASPCGLRWPDGERTTPLMAVMVGELYDWPTSAFVPGS